jgi:photosystem II stability/assembly factor-like uncharacterized protein
MLAGAAAAVMLAGCNRLPPFLPSLVEVPLVQATGDPFPGGRVVAVTLDPRNDNVAIAATHSGGLFRTVDGANTWRHVDGIVPNRLWDVQIDPASPDVVFATVAVDTHNPPLSGVWRSSDGGATWSRPAAANFPDCNNAPAYGRWISPGPGQHVFVATECGLTVSHDAGVSWSRVVPSPATPRLSGVFSQPGPTFPGNPNDVIVDVCGDAGPQRSTNAGATFAPPAGGTSFPLPTCSLAGSPDERTVLFAGQTVSGGDGILWESDDSGATWTQLVRRNNPGRFAWVRVARTPASQAPRYDLWFHAGSDISHLSCDSSRTGLRCDAASETPFPTPVHDYGGIALAPNGCPRYAGQDHGALASIDCGQSWLWRNNGLRALQLYNVTGTILPDHADLYLGSQDNSVWASDDSGASWPSRQDAEGLLLQAPHTAPQHGLATVTGTICSGCSRHGWADHLTNDRGWPFTTDANVPSPNGNAPFIIPGSSGASRFVEIENSQLWVRDTNGAWSGKSPTLPPLAEPPQLFVSGPPDAPTVYAVTQRADGTHSLLRITGLDQPALTLTDVGQSSTGDVTLGDVYIWAPDDNPFIRPFVVGVAPQNPSLVIVGDRLPGVMRVSTDAGTTWRVQSDLTGLVIDGGRLQFHSPFHGLQAHVIKFNPANSNHILVGTEASGVLESCDGGTTWSRMRGSTAATAVSDFFFDEVRRTVHVATYGRSLWRFAYARPLIWPDRCWVAPPVTITVPLPPTLAVMVATSPRGDPARVDITVDGVRWASAVGDGFASGPRPLPIGAHHVDVVPAGGAINEAAYTYALSGACQANGVVTVAANQTAVCQVAVVHR